MKKELLFVIFVCLSFSLFAKNNNWRLGYSENNGIALLNGHSNINSILQSENLPVLPNSEEMSSVRSLFLSSDKWMFSLGKMSLNSSNSNELNGYASDFTAGGWLFKCGYIIFSDRKSELYLSMGGGRMNTLGNVRPNEETNLLAIEDLFSYGSERSEFEQNYTSVSLGLSYLYPLLTNMLNYADLKLGVNSSYTYNIGTSAKLNGRSFALDSNNFTAFSFGIALELSLDLARIVNE